MYVGRLLVVGPGVGAYRVSSRSFPNRRIDGRGAGTLTVGPTDDAPSTNNPYVSYNCVRTAASTRAGDGGADGPGADESDAGGADAGVPWAVIGNGSHVDPVAEKRAAGYPARDALAEALLALDYEKDDYDTPRIAGVITPEIAHVGTVRRDALVVRAVDEPHLLATYEEDDPRPFEFDARSPIDAAREAYDLPFEHPVCAAGVGVDETGVETAVVNGDGE